MADSLTGSNAMAVINRWRHLLIKGEKQQLDQFLDDVEQRFCVLGWERDSIYERKLNRGPDHLHGFHCWNSGPVHRPYTLLCLNRTTDRRIRGGSFDSPDQQGSIAELAGTIERVLTEVIEPVAAGKRLRVAYPELGPISRFGTRTEAAMQSLAEVGEEQWPLPEKAEPAWRAFVNTAYREDVALKPEELQAWFEDNGWSAAASAELAKKFYADATLLQEYEDER